MLIVYILCLFACFIFLARIVDLFFIVSLDKISKDLKLSNDAAGATLMAVGSSAPELFVALFAVIKPGDHQVIGIGSIVGSAIFNLLAIVGVAALVKKAKLTREPVIRDLIFYASSVGLLVYFIWDGKLTLFETAIFMVFYICYVVAVVFWRKWFPYEDKVFNDTEEDEKSKGIIVVFDKLLSFIFPKQQKYYQVFFFSILVIAGLSWILVELAVLISEGLGIPESIIALTVLAVGTSIPDLFSSMIVAKQGRGEMAVSNAIGSNIFDILVGLGLPFIIVMLISGGTIKAGGDILSSTIILSLSVILVVLLLIINKWKIGKITGAILVGSYILYIVYEIVTL